MKREWIWQIILSQSIGIRKGLMVLKIFGLGNAFTATAVVCEVLLGVTWDTKGSRDIVVLSCSFHHLHGIKLRFEELTKLVMYMYYVCVEQDVE